MSRAFVNEDAGADRPDLPELPVPPGPNIVTPRGLATLRAQIARLGELGYALDFKTQEWSRQAEPQAA